MDRVDYDCRIPGAGKFRSVFEYVGLTLLNERRAYQGPVYSEGGVHWFYAGLCDGNYTWIDKRLPVFPDFQLLKINPLEMDAMANVSGYEYIAYAYAYGNIGQLSNGSETIKRYAFLQPFQDSYTMVPVKEISYFDVTGFVSTSEAVKNDLIKAPRIHIAYESGLMVYVNFFNETWDVEASGKSYRLPQYGVLVYMPEKNMLAHSSENSLSENKSRMDKVYTDNLYFIDTHDEVINDDLGGKGAYMLKREKFGWEVIPVEKTEVFDFSLSLLGLSGLGVDIEALDKDGNSLGIVNKVPLYEKVHFNHNHNFYKYRICPVISQYNN